MPRVFRSALFAALLLISPAAFAQAASTPGPVRDPQAVATVQAGLTAMGGTATISQVQNSVVSGTSVDQPAQQNTAQSFTWTYADKEFRNENNAASGGHVLVSNGGSPQDFHDGAWTGLLPIAARTNLPYHIPALVLCSELNNPGYALIFLGSTTLNGTSAIHVQTRDDSDLTGHVFTLQDWYFDSATGLPLRVEYQIPVSQNPSESLQASVDFSNFTIVSGILVPFQLTFSEGPISFVATVASATFNTSTDPSQFAPSTRGAH
jgi:hypothetical protein